MPTYDFRCPSGHDFERFYGRISEAPSEVACPVCGAMAIRQISGGAGLIFKGSGFYITDYGKDGKKDQRSSSSPAAAGAGGSDAAGGGGGESKGASSAGAGASEGGASGAAAAASSAPAAAAPPKPAAGE